MPLVTRIRHLGAFALVEANSRLFIDGQAYTPNNLAPIAFDKLGAISAISTQKQEYLGDPLFSLSRALWVQPISPTSSSVEANNVFFDSTISLCGKNVGVTGVRYDSVNKRYYVCNKKNQYSYGDEWCIKIYDSDFNIVYTSDMARAGSSVTGQTGIFLKPKVDNIQFLMTQQLCQRGTGINYTDASKVLRFDSTLSTAPMSPLVSVLKAGGVGPLVQSKGWMQAVYQDQANANNWTLLVDSSSGANASSASTFNCCYALNRTSGAAICLGTTSPRTYTVVSLDVLNTDGSVKTPGIGYYLYADTAGCLASNAEYVSQTGSGANDVFFYTMRTNPAYATTATPRDQEIRRALQITVCKVSDMNSDSPSMTVVPCTFNPADFWLTSDTPTATRRFRPFIFRDTLSGLDYLGVITYEPALNTTAPFAQNAQQMIVFRIGGGNDKNELTYIADWKVPLGDYGIVRGAMPMDESMKKWLVCYDDKFSVYQWNPTSGFSRQSTQNIKPQWVGVDTLGRLWVAESETLSLIFGDGQKLYYFPTSGTAIALQAAFQASSYTFSGTPINSNIKINALDLSGARTEVEVLVNLEGSNVTFADGSTRKLLTTSSSGDTLVPIIVKSTGLLRATIMEAV